MRRRTFLGAAAMAFLTKWITAPTATMAEAARAEQIDTLRRINTGLLSFDEARQEVNYNRSHPVPVVITESLGGGLYRARILDEGESRQLENVPELVRKESSDPMPVGHHLLAKLSPRGSLKAYEFRDCA